MIEVSQINDVDINPSLFFRKQMEGRVNTRQLLIGLCVLFLGALFYYLFRSAEHTYFLKFFSINLYLKDFLPPLFILIGNSLPTFMHVFAFTLMTAGIIARQKRGYVVVCLFWFAIDVLFETAQFFGNIVSQIIPDWFSEFLFLENTRNYFLCGHFDWLDLLSITLGSLLAYILLMKTKETRGQDHEN